MKKVKNYELFKSLLSKAMGKDVHRLDFADYMYGIADLMSSENDCHFFMLMAHKSTSVGGFVDIDKLQKLVGDRIDNMLSIR